MERINGPKILTSIAAIAAAAIFATPAGAASARTHAAPVIVVSRPTVVAFYPLAADAAHQGESLEDFQFYVREDGKHLRQAGIRVEETYAGSFRLRVGAALRTVRPEGGQSGYYFIAPGKEPRIVYGVTTDDELLQLAGEYFGKELE